MRSSKVLGLALVIGALLAPGLVTAQAPAQMPMQGYLTDAMGAPVDGSRPMQFSVFTTETGGTAVFTESQSVMLDAGYFTAYMGDVSSLDLSVFRDNSLLYVEVQVDGEVLSPRIQLATVPYAAYAEYSGTAGDAATVGGMASSAFAPATHSHAWTDLTGVPADLADGDADTTYTAGSGLTLTGTTFALNSTTVQSRVSGICPAGQSIRAIDAAGGVTCEVDDVGGVYTAGPGLALAGTTFSVNTSATQSRVSSTCPAGSAIRAIAQSGTVTCQTDTNSGGDITSVTAGSGLTGGGATGAVTVRIGTGTVTAAHLATGSVAAAEIVDGSVGSREIFNSTLASVHYGALGVLGQSSNWNPYNTSATGNGVWLEGSNGESGGFYANGDMAAVWSPGDSTVNVGTALTTGTPVRGVLLALFDEDMLGGGAARTGRTAAFVFSNLDPTRRFAAHNGAFLSTGGVWTNTSDRNVKHGFEPVDSEQVLERLATVPIQRWSYDSEEAGVQHMGPMAQDFYEAFDLGYDERSIPTLDADGVALVSIQALYHRNEALQARNATLEQQVAELGARLDLLEALIRAR